MCCFSCFGLVIKLVALVVSKDILVSVDEFCWLQPPVLCVEGRDGAIFLSVRDGRWIQQIDYHLKLKPARKADMEDVLSSAEACWGGGWRT